MLLSQRRLVWTPTKSALQADIRVLPSGCHIISAPSFPCRGTLPEPGELQWPREPLCSSFLETASRLQLPRFTYQYPEVLLTLLKHFLAMVHVSAAGGLVCWLPAEGLAGL